MDTPCILVTSCGEIEADTLIKDIIECEQLPDGKPIIENIVGYSWKIDTKYYSADVLLCQTKYRTIGDQDFANRVEAFVVYFDSGNQASFDSVKLWTTYLDLIDPEIKILVCNKCTDETVVNRMVTQTWCIDNGFELVELDPELTSDSDTEDDFMETTGLPRIVQSLHAHTWANLTLKDDTPSMSPYIRQLMQEQRALQDSQSDNETNLEAVNKAETDTEDCTQNAEHNENNIPDHDTEAKHNIVVSKCDDKSVNHSVSENSKGVTGCESKGSDTGSAVSDSKLKDKGSKDKEGNHEQEDKCSACGDAGTSESDKTVEAAANGDTKKKKKPTKDERLESLLPSNDMELFAALGSEDPDGESFEKLFEKLAHMKEKATNLPFPERKKYAENVAIAFWNAMGGDEDEIGDLDSDG